MAARRTDRLRDPRLWLELFLLLNLAGLAPDIYLAHSFNNFRAPEEYLPLWFSLAAPVVLLAGLLAWQVRGKVSLWKALGFAVGTASVLVGVAGTVLHLRSRFFEELTLHSLVYSAPFAAPLAYVGLGLLLVMNRMVEPESEEWPRWVLFFALGGFVGNFVFSLADHAINGFFHETEWIPVMASALAVGFLLVPFCVRVTRGTLIACAAVMVLQGAVGLLGFGLHLGSSWRGLGPGWFGDLVHGAPVLAPLLFADLMVLALIGLWALAPHLVEKTNPVTV